MKNRNPSENIILQNAKAKEALEKLNRYPLHSTLFVLNEKKQLVGSLTDGDIRRGLLKGLKVDDAVSSYMNKKFHSLSKKNYTIETIRGLNAANIKLVPLLNEKKEIIKLIDLDIIHSLLPVDVVMMAGGEGIRLRPLTEKTPKPLLQIGSKPIIDYNIDRLVGFGVYNFFITLRYMADKIKAHLKDGSQKEISFSYAMEKEPLGTVGGVRLFNNFSHDYVLILNSDLLTNIDFEDFFLQFKNQNADMSIATIPYNVNVPYAILELSDKSQITSLKEKPTYTYFANAGIYLVKRKLLDMIPVNKKFDATDLIELLIAKKKKVVSFPILSYWLDIGNMDDFRRAQEDVKHLNF